VWLSGSDGTGETHLYYRAISSEAHTFSGKAAVRWNLPGWRAILQATRNSGQEAVSQQPLLGGESRLQTHTDIIWN